MRIDINLASEPFEEARRFLLRWGLLLGAVAVLTVLLVWSAVSRWSNGREARQEIRSLKEQIARLDQERQQVEAKLNEPGNRQTWERSQFLNRLITRKAFVWTQIFSDLEEIMPPQVQVVSIRPEVTRDNRLQVRMTVAGSSRDRAMSLLRHLEETPSFRRPEVRSENLQRQVGEPVELEIVADYVPHAGTRPEGAD